MSKQSGEGFNALGSRAWMRDGKNVHAGEALVLACLMHVKKGRTLRAEEELKMILDVYAARS